MLAGNPASGESADFPDQVGYAVGADVSVNPRLTLAFDLLGRLRDRRRAAPAPRRSTRSTAARCSRTSRSRATRSSDLSGSFGFKANLLDRLLVEANLLFKLDEHGLRDKVTPLIGIEYAF